MIQVKLGQKGEIVIPKKMREYLGLSRDHPITLELHKNSIEIKSIKKDIVSKWKKEAKFKSKDIVHGNQLYEDVF